MTRVLTIGYGLESIGTNDTAKFLGTYLDKSKRYVASFQEGTTNANFTQGGGLLSWGNTPDYPLEYAINNGFLSLLLVDYLLPAASFSTFLTTLPSGSLDNVVTFAKSQVGRGGRCTKAAWGCLGFRFSSWLVPCNRLVV